MILRILAFAMLSTIFKECRTLSIVAIESPPFVCLGTSPCRPIILTKNFVRNTSDGCAYGGIMSQNSGCVHGYLIDLVKVLSQYKQQNVTFELWFTTSKRTSGYTNLVKEIFSPGTLPFSLCGENVCDMAIGDININWPRRRLTNARFSAPFMEVGLQILGRIDSNGKVNSVFRFMQPFSPDLWISILVTIICMTFALVFVEAPQFRARFKYIKQDAGALSWQQKNVSRYLTQSFFAPTRPPQPTPNPP